MFFRVSQETSLRPEEDDAFFELEEPLSELLLSLSRMSSSEEDVVEQALRPKASAVDIPSFQNVDFFIESPLENFIYDKYNSLVIK